MALVHLTLRGLSSELFSTNQFDRKNLPPIAYTSVMSTPWSSAEEWKSEYSCLIIRELRLLWNIRDVQNTCTKSDFLRWICYHVLTKVRRDSGQFSRFSVDFDIREISRSLILNIDDLCHHILSYCIVYLLTSCFGVRLVKHLLIEFLNIIILFHQLYYCVIFLLLDPIFIFIYLFLRFFL